MTFDYDNHIVEFSKKVLNFIENDFMEKNIIDFSKDIDQYIETYNPHEIVLDIELIFRNAVILVQNKFNYITCDESLVSSLQNHNYYFTSKSYCQNMQLRRNMNN